MIGRFRTGLALAATAALLAGCGQGGGAATLSAEDAALIAALPAPFNTGDPVNGRVLFSLCSACHTVTPGGANMVGPNLHGVFGRMAASRPDFAYSEALKATGWTWDPQHLDTWMADPLRVLPGSKMVFVGLPEAKQRADLIAYLVIETNDQP